MSQSLLAYRGTGAGLVLPYFLARLAEAYGKGERIEAGLRVLDEALAFVDKHGECWWEAELHRLKGVLSLQQAVPDAKQAEDCLRQALAIASRQRTKSLELRAATSLSQLWQRQGKRDDARQVLAEVHGWFTEGFDTADLKDARALLDELSTG